MQGRGVALNPIWGLSLGPTCGEAKFSDFAKRREPPMPMLLLFTDML